MSIKPRHLLLRLAVEAVSDEAGRVMLHLENEG